MDLRQKQLAEWEARNFPRSRYESMTKDQLIDTILIMQVTIGMAEEVGEISHAVLKGIQGIRDGVGGIKKDAIGDGFGDTMIYGMQLLSKFKMNAEEELDKTINTVLARDWNNDPSEGK